MQSKLYMNINISTIHKNQTRYSPKCVRPITNAHSHWPINGAQRELIVCSNCLPIREQCDRPMPTRSNHEVRNISGQWSGSGEYKLNVLSHMIFTLPSVHLTSCADMDANGQLSPYVNASIPSSTLPPTTSSSVATVQGAFHYYGNINVYYPKPQHLQSPVLLQPQQSSIPQFQWQTPTFVGHSAHDLYRPQAQRSPEFVPINSPPSVASTSECLLRFIVPQL